MNDEQLRAAAAGLASNRRVRCWTCRAWTTDQHTWDDGLAFAGPFCRDCARPRAERQDEERRRDLEAWRAFAADHPAAAPIAAQLADEYAAERRGDLTFVRTAPVRAPGPLLRAFRRWRDHRAAKPAASGADGRTRRQRPVPDGGI